MLLKRLRIYWFGLNETERQEYYRAQAAILPTPDGGPVPLPFDPEAEALPAVKNWCHPFRDKNHSLHQLTHLAKAAAGFYPLGVNGLWHGGVHFDGGTAGTVDQSSVHCLADGEVVAYRIDQYSPSTGYIAHKSPVLRPFSRNFVLVRHRLQPPKIDGSPDIPPSLIVYSLYMHLQDWAVYQQNAETARPGFWPEGKTRQVKATVNDVDLDNLNERGLNIRNQASEGKIIGFLPRGAKVTVSGKGAYRRLENTLGPDKLKNPDGSLRGYVAFSHLLPINTGEYRVVTQNGPLTVRADAHRQAESIGVLQQGTEVNVSGESDYRKLEQINQYVHFDSLQGVPEPLAQDRVVVLDQPVPIKAGDLIGHIGLYQDSHEDPERRLHLEVFSDDNVKAFIEASRAWALRLPATSKTWLKLVKGTAVVAHQEGFSDKQPPTLKADHTPSDADLLLPKSLLDGLPAARKIKVPAATGRKACTWYRIEGLVHDAEQTLLDGWVCEEVGVTPWVSPWAWENYDLIYNKDGPQHLLTSYLRATGQFNEAQLERWGPVADMADTGPLKSRLYDIIDRNRDGTITAKEIQTAISLPAHAQSIAQLIIFSESEWCYTRRKWDSLDEPSGHTSSTPHLNWFSEKDRIKEISWWGDVAEKLGLRADGKVYHFHPLGLVGAFKTKERRISVELLEKVTGKSGAWFTGKGGGRRFANEFAEKYPNIYKYDKFVFVEQLNSALDRYAIRTPYQQAHFIAQCFHESAAFETTVEFGSGAQYDPGRHAGAIANGNTEQGDGAKYKGKGLIQLTWKNNYFSYSKYRGFDFVKSPDAIAADMFNAIDVSCWYWRHNGAISRKYNSLGDINILIDNEPSNVKLVTRAVNGGDNGLHERESVYEALCREWGLA